MMGRAAAAANFQVPSCRGGRGEETEMGTGTSADLVLDLYMVERGGREGQHGWYSAGRYHECGPEEEVLCPGYCCSDGDVTG